jgi:hypothetical protein
MLSDHQLVKRAGDGQPIIVRQLGFGAGAFPAVAEKLDLGNHGNPLPRQVSVLLVAHSGEKVHSYIVPDRRGDPRWQISKQRLESSSQLLRRMPLQMD